MLTRGGGLLAEQLASHPPVRLKGRLLVVAAASSCRGGLTYDGVIGNVFHGLRRVRFCLPLFVSLRRAARDRGAGGKGEGRRRCARRARGSLRSVWRWRWGARGALWGRAARDDVLEHGGGTRAGQRFNLLLQPLLGDICMRTACPWPARPNDAPPTCSFAGTTEEGLRGEARSGLVSNAAWDVCAGARGTRHACIHGRPWGVRVALAVRAQRWPCVHEKQTPLLCSPPPVGGACIACALSARCALPCRPPELLLLLSLCPFP